MLTFGQQNNNPGSLNNPTPTPTSPDQPSQDLPPGVRITVAEHTIHLPGSELGDPDKIDEARSKIAVSEEEVSVVLDHFLKLEDAARFAANSLLAEIKNGRFQVDTVEFSNLLDAVLAHHPHDDSDGIRALKLAALEIAALKYPDVLDVACDRLRQRLIDLGVTTSRRDLLRDARQILERLAAPPDPTQDAMLYPISDTLPDAPLAEELLVPPGWRIDHQGVQSRQDANAKLPAPLLIIGRARERHSQTEYLTLAWPRDGDWRHRVVERKMVADARIAVNLSAYGVAVTSNNAKTLVNFLAEFEQANIDALPTDVVSSQLGWHGEDGEDGFLLGDHVVTAGGYEATESRGGAVRFRGADEGDEQLARAFKSAGTLEEWLRAIAAIAPYSRVRLGLYASFAPPLLAILRAANFILDFAGENTAGKTTTLRVAGSVWGDPIETSPASTVHTWDGTAVWRERAPAVLKDLPYILDDTRRARRREDVQQTIYDVAQGRGRGRGSPTGLAKQQSWRTVLLTSGEQPATSFTEAGGTRARVLTLWGSPFGRKDGVTGMLVTDLDAKIKSNYGHAGPACVNFLVRNRELWDGWREEYSVILREYKARAGDNPLAGRLAEHFATLSMTAFLVHQALALPWDDNDPIDPLYTELVQEAGEADRAAAALRHVIEWATAHQCDFYSLAGDRPQCRAYLGTWERTNSQWQFIGILPTSLRTALAERGFDYESVVRTWADRGWLRTQPGDAQRRSLKVRIGGQPTSVVAITYEAALAAGAV